MGLGKMRTPINIVSVETVKDSAGFASYADNVIASLKAVKEYIKGAEKELNDSVFSGSNVIFKFRRINGVEVTPAHIITYGAERYRILSVKEINRMYIEAETEKVSPSKR
jgi:hypothetical protein